MFVTSTQETPLVFHIYVGNWQISSLFQLLPVLCYSTSYMAFASNAFILSYFSYQKRPTTSLVFPHFTPTCPHFLFELKLCSWNYNFVLGTYIIAFIASGFHLLLLLYSICVYLISLLMSLLLSLHISLQKPIFPFTYN